MYQVLKGMKYLHSADIVHRDMKPSNLLLNEDCLVKIADLGLARTLSSMETQGDSATVLTDYVATRWYRAPEILLGSTKYTKAVDVWAIGCILAECIGGKPLFPGTSTMNQLERVIEVTGQPTKQDIEAMNSTFAATMLESLNVKQYKSIESIYPDASKDAIELMKQCLFFNPNKRPTCIEMLQHAFVAQFHNPKEELEHPCSIQIPIDDNTKITVAEYRDKLYKEVVAKKKEQRRRFSFGRKATPRKE